MSINKVIIYTTLNISMCSAVRIRNIGRVKKETEIEKSGGSVRESERGRDR